jgi:CheY-like chemotaxis protein
VVVVGNGREAVEALEEENCDLVLMDVQMSVLDGFQATAMIRKKERVNGLHIPIAAMTAHAMKGDKERCRAAGMDGYISKPFGAESLTNVIEAMASVTSVTYISARPKSHDQLSCHPDAPLAARRPLEASFQG